MKSNARIETDGVEDSTSTTPTTAPQKMPHWLRFALVGIAVVLIVVFGVSAIQRPSTTPPVTVVVTATVQATAMAQPTPTASCTPTSHYLSIITTQELSSQWEVAGQNAEAALRDPELCHDGIAILRQKAVTDALEALYQQQFAPWDVPGQEDGVKRFAAVQRRATEYGVEFPSALQTATRAYGSGQFLLAKVAFEQAYRQGELHSSDHDLLTQYTATLYNLGVWRTTNTTGVVHDEGLQLLVACHLVDVRYKVGSGACQGKLTELLGHDQWPIPSSTPLLDT